MSLSNPLNLALIPPILYLLYRAILPPYPKQPDEYPTEYHQDPYNWSPAKHPPVVAWRKFTRKDLADNDGRKSDRILLAIARLNPHGEVDQRTVFDVTAGKSFYGPDGVYGNFAGQDASRGMAKQSFDDEMITPLDQPIDLLSDLSQSEIENMHNWHTHFTNKYTVCGELEE